LGGLIGIGQALRYRIGVGMQGMAVKKRIKNRRDHQQLDGDRQRDLPGWAWGAS